MLLFCFHFKSERVCALDMLGFCIRKQNKTATQQHLAQPASQPQLQYNRKQKKHNNNTIQLEEIFRLYTIWANLKLAVLFITSSLMPSRFLFLIFSFRSVSKTEKKTTKTLQKQKN